jgi:hypothetical protein
MILFLLDELPTNHMGMINARRDADSRLRELSTSSAGDPLNMLSVSDSRDDLHCEGWVGGGRPRGSSWSSICNV